MHKIHEKEFTIDDFSHEHLTGETDDLWVNADGIDFMCSAWDFCQITCYVLNHYRELYLKTKDKKYWWQMIQLLPSNYNQTRNVTLNYEVLANIYKSRKNHKLDCWRDFCAWIKTLPYSELICGDEDVMTQNEQRENVANKFCEIGNINPLSKEEIEQAVNLSRVKEN